MRSHLRLSSHLRLHLCPRRYRRRSPGWTRHRRMHPRNPCTSSRPRMSSQRPFPWSRQLASPHRHLR
ncbi:hypothetical protein ACFPRL_07785 [Pseudoclavibacter helvolus]